MSDNNSENQVLDQVQELVQDQVIVENNGRQNDNDGANSENESSVDSAAERARGSGMSIDERKSPEEQKEIGDQKVIEVEHGPLYQQKVAVDDRMFLARVAEQGG